MSEAIVGRGTIVGLAAETEWGTRTAEGARVRVTIDALLRALETPNYLTAQLLGAAINHRWGIGCQARSWTGVEDEHVLQLFAPETEQVYRTIRWRYGRYRREDLPRLVWRIGDSFRRAWFQEMGHRGNQRGEGGLL